MKIAFITYEFPPDRAIGGIATYTYQVANILVNNNVIVHVFASSSSRNISIEESGVYIHWIKSSDPFSFQRLVLGKFISIHASVNFDLIESPEIHGNAWLIKKRFPNLPMVVRLHTPNYIVESLKKTYVPLHRKLRFVIGSLKRKSFDLGYWRKYNRNEDPDYQFTLLADAISAPSVYLKNWVVENWKIDPLKIKVYSNVFEPPLSFSKLPIYDDFRYKTIVFYGRLDVLKGLRNATIALKYILEKYPDWHFRIIGNDCSGPDPLSISMRNWMKIKLKKYESQISFLDRIEYVKLSEFINESEILIFPSLFESFSYVCIEGMSAGKAIVGSKLGGMNDLIQNNETGMLVNPYKIKEIIYALEKLISNQTFTFNIRKAARDKVLESGHNEQIIAETLIYYKNIIRDKSF